MGLPVFPIGNRTLFHKEDFELWQTKVTDKGHRPDDHFALWDVQRRRDPARFAKWATQLLASYPYSLASTATAPSAN